MLDNITVINYEDECRREWCLGGIGLARRPELEGKLILTFLWFTVYAYADGHSTVHIRSKYLTKNDIVLL